ncbi:hypothetical protein EZV62_007794 [Acer yangbiense]|uniref:Uncharacterized protein n=1 Tax=Acer yangbiense TaxID=1000413 RepID=A0A5C7ICE2_9ROSI|nr:hypothetical protein EZV62_007794 [Acer yangbiense]
MKDVAQVYEIKVETSATKQGSLNAEFNQVRIQILEREELPSLNESIVVVRAEENRRSVMLEPTILEESAMVSTGGKSCIP